MSVNRSTVSKHEFHTALASVWTFLTIVFVLTVDEEVVVKIGIGGLMLFLLLREIWLANKYRRV